MHFVPAMRAQWETPWTRYFRAILFCNSIESYPTGFYSHTSKSSTADRHVLCELQQGRMWSAVSKGIRQLRQAQEGVQEEELLNPEFGTTAARFLGQSKFGKEQEHITCVNVAD